MSTETVKDETDNKPITCPHCEKEIHLRYGARVPERQTVSFKISFEGERLSAKTLGGTITEFEKLLVAVAKDVGVKVHVFIESLEYKAHEATVGFLITTVRNAGGAGSDGSLVGETK